MGWQCKLCTFVASSKGGLIKHYRLKHRHLGHGHFLPCIHLNNPLSKALGPDGLFFSKYKRGI